MSAPISNLRQRAYDHLQRKLLSGELHAGSLVSEQSLAAEIGMSRTPVREAIRTLEQEGVLEQVPRYGTRVRKLERRDLIELYELREAVEPFAVAKAAVSALPEDILSLRSLCDEIGKLARELSKSKLPSLDASQMQRLLSADLGFHLMLLRAAGNHRMMKIVSDSRLLTGIFGTQRQAHTRSVLEQTHREHQTILDAVEKGDAKAASRAMAEHIHASKQQALAAYDQARIDHDARSIPLAMPQQLVAEIDRIQSQRSKATRSKSRTSNQKS
jgi:DNA-binding GntR family transcriptional regulator